MKRVGILLFSLAVIAQDKPNFSGSWLLQIEKSDFSHFPVPDTQINVIEHKAVDIKLTQTIRSASVPGARPRWRGTTLRTAKKA